MGIISVTNMTSKITKGKVKPTDSVTVMLYKKFQLVSNSCEEFTLFNSCCRLTLRLLSVLCPASWTKITLQLSPMLHLNVRNDLWFCCSILLFYSRSEIKKCERSRHTHWPLDLYHTQQAHEEWCIQWSQWISFQRNSHKWQMLNVLMQPWLRCVYHFVLYQCFSIDYCSYIIM